MKKLLLTGVLFVCASCQPAGGHQNEAVGVAAGAAVGAGTGAVVGHQSGQAGAGALVGAGTGAVVGGLAGTVVDKNSDEEKEKLPVIQRQEKEMQKQLDEEEDAERQEYYNDRLNDYLVTH